jgi:hypothetical protein
LAAALQQEPGVEVEQVNGDRGELTVSVDGQQVAQKKGDSLPTVDEVRAAVRQAGQATAGSAGR